MLRLLLIFFSLLLGASFPLDAGAAALKKATFLPHWSPQAQFAGYYVALEKGFYREKGIDLTIIQGGPNKQPNKFLEKRKADFVSMWLSAALQRRSSGVRLINIGQIIQRSSLMLVTKKSSNIMTPESMNGKKVGLWAGDLQIQPKAFFNKYNLHVTAVPQSSSVNLFLRGGVDVASAMWYNEYHIILNAGINPDELTTFFFSDYGLNFPEDGIYTLEDTYKKDPALSCAFVEASLEGWLYAFAHPDEALDIVLKYATQAKIPANWIHQHWMLERMKDIIIPKDKNVKLGALQQDDYKRVAQELMKNGAIKTVPDYRSFSVRCGSNAEK
jgi:NitT/TauT family transport system substrate-binding protein